MNNSVYTHIRTDKHVIAYRYRAFIENGQIKIAYKVFPNRNLLSEITPKRAMDDKPLPYLAKQSPQYGLPFGFRDGGSALSS